MKRTSILAGVALGALFIQGCATDDPNRQAKTGGAVGAVVGAIVGHQLDDDAGRFVGAALGGMTGAAVGNYMDEQERAYERTLSEERQQNQLQMKRLRDDTLVVTLDSEVSFDVDRVNVKRAFRPALDKLADLLLRYERSVAYVVGHTDNTGGAAYNQELSEKRARRVAGYLHRQGVPKARLRYEGRGETEPRASNAKPAGRQLNRRVDIYIRPIVKGREREAYQPPRYGRY